MLLRLANSRTAFFLCDVQESFRPLIYQFNDVINTSRKMVRASKALDIPLIVTEQYPQRLGPTVPEISIEDATLNEPKKLFSMCVPKVNEFLYQKQISNVVLWGIESHVCIAQTALDLLQKDLSVFVLADGVSSMNSMEIPISLQLLRQSGAFITSSDSVLFALLKEASHPTFKAISQIVKDHSKETTANQLFKAIASKI